MKKAFKVFYFRDKMKNKPSVKAFSALASLEEHEELKATHVDSLISEIERETRNTISALAKFRNKLPA